MSESIYEKAADALRNCTAGGFATHGELGRAAADAVLDAVVEELRAQRDTAKEITSDASFVNGIGFAASRVEAWAKRQGD
jgi:hypothetical protein